MTETLSKNNLGKTLVKIALTIPPASFLVLHSMQLLKFDNIGFALLILAILPWLLPFMQRYLVSSKILGTEFKFLQAKIDDQGQKISNQQEIINKLVVYSLGESPYILLWELDNNAILQYKNDNTFKRWMNFLLDTGLIMPKAHLNWLDFDKVNEGENLVSIAQATPAGKFMIELRGNPHKMSN